MNKRIFIYFYLSAIGLILRSNTPMLTIADNSATPPPTDRIRQRRQKKDDLKSRVDFVGVDGFEPPTLCL